LIVVLFSTSTIFLILKWDSFLELVPQPLGFIGGHWSAVTVAGAKGLLATA
jgi:hypothetical protein